MDSWKTFFVGQSKDAALTNNQQNGFGLFAGRSAQGVGGNGLLTNNSNGNAGAKMANHHDVKRKDSDNYFYIMWRS